MANKSRATNRPQRISRLAWYYENDDNIEIIYEIYDQLGKYIRTDSMIIPKKMLMKSLERMNSAAASGEQVSK